MFTKISFTNELLSCFFFFVFFSEKEGALSFLLLFTPFFLFLFKMSYFSVLFFLKK